MAQAAGRSFGSARYGHLSAAKKAAADRLVASVCAPLDSWTTRLRPAQKNALVSAYKLLVSALDQMDWLTPAQASTLKSLAGKL